jgi:replicative DNA helicase Mcm
MSEIPYETFEEMVQFLDDRYSEEIYDLAEKYPKERESLWIDHHDVWRWDTDVADDVVVAPEKFRTTFSEALGEYDMPVDVPLQDARIRFHNVGEVKQLDELRTDDVEKLVTVTCQVSKASAVRPVVQKAAFECQRCGWFSKEPVGDSLHKPPECGGCERQGPFNLDIGKSTVQNHQLIRLKQPPEQETTNSQIGNELDAHVLGDLAGDVQAGERAEVTGVLRAESEDGEPTLSFHMDAWGVVSKNDDYGDVDVSKHIDDVKAVADETPFKTLAESVAPSISGGADVDVETPWGETYDKYWWIRLATGVASLFSSWRRPSGDGTSERGDSHTLLIGDPSTGKSSIMDAIQNIAPRADAQSGKNASGAGLTAAAVRSDFGDAEWSLEPGALVKAHNGVALVDEIDKMAADDLDRLHSALEKQRLEISKAGINTTLKCETALLAAGNPKDSRFNDYDVDHEQFSNNIVASLLDRFDLVFTLKDRPDKDKDATIAESRIGQRSESGLLAKGELDADEKEHANPTADIETLKAWVVYARENYRPVLVDGEAKQRLKDYYVTVRAEGDDGVVPATVRTLDGLLRLSEACARVRLSETVEMLDVEMAIALTQVSLEDIGYDPETGQLDSDYRDGNTTHNQRDRKARVRGVIETLSTPDEGAPYEEIVETLSDVPQEKIDHDLQKFRESGDVYEPEMNTYRVV